MRIIIGLIFIAVCFRLGYYLGKIGDVLNKFDEREQE